jgi:PiT family inorganic phosphate transporter
MNGTLAPPESPEAVTALTEPELEDQLNYSCMASPALVQPTLLDEKLISSSRRRTPAILWTGVVVAGLAYIATQLRLDLAPVHYASIFPYLLLGLALAIALGFEFVNGFHDTANAVATVIYTHSMTPHSAVIYSGILNFVGVLFSSGTVAFAIVSLLPVELMLKANDGSGFAIIFALLVAAILWNLATWYHGLPASSSHTMIGSILGVGLAYHLIEGKSGAAGLNWDQVSKVFKALIFSPAIGFILAALIFAAFKFLLRDPRLYEAPRGNEPPPFYIRLMLILMCGGVSYAHGQNDGQKGMGLIMLILVGTVPTAYALNHAIDSNQVQTFAAVSTQTAGVLESYIVPSVTSTNARAELERYVQSGAYRPAVLPALRSMVLAIRTEATGYGTLADVPDGTPGNIRNQMYLTSESLRLLAKNGPHTTANDAAVLANYAGFLDKSTKFIPTWVKVAVALALGMGTMIGWKRIVITVGEKIGKTRMTYAQGATAQMVAMATILGAGMYGLPVSTTHVLSSSVAGSMSANGNGLQRVTLRNILLAWVFTLPAAALLSGTLFWLFHLLAR